MSKKFFIPNSYHELVEQAAEHSGYEIPSTQELLNNFGIEYLSRHAQAPLFYVVDYVRKKYLYVDPSINKVLGYDSEYITSGGPHYFTGLWHPQDFKIYSEQILPESLRFLHTQPASTYGDFSVSINYRIKNADGNWIKFLQRSTYFLASSDGHPLAAVGFALDITHYKESNSIVHTIEKIDKHFGNQYKEPVYKRIYHPDKETVFTNRERQVLTLIYKGYSSKQIAEELSVSLHTINNHRKNILDKTGSRNVADLMRYTSENGFL